MPNRSQRSQGYWAIRESVLAATAFIPGATRSHEGWEDSAVPPARLGAYLHELRALYNKYGYRGAFYGHFGDGCIHTRIDFDLDTADGKARPAHFWMRPRIWSCAMGDRSRENMATARRARNCCPRCSVPNSSARFEEFKSVWDPQGKMNPGKIVNPTASWTTSAGGDHFKPVEPQTHFHFPRRKTVSSAPSLRCVGVGKCRNEEGGLMCPSYMATRNEKDSTRGRAHLLV